MRYGNGISKSKNHWAVPDNRIRGFAVPLMATYMLPGTTEQRQGEKIFFSPATNTENPFNDRRESVWYALIIITFLVAPVSFG